MEMMYSLISKALNEQGLLGQQHPRDYLTFVTLGNRCAVYTPNEKSHLVFTNERRKR
jgi:hypothetical protein